MSLRNRATLMARDEVADAPHRPVRRLSGNSYTSSTISGSPPWMSPEQICGKDLTLKADVFSYGIIVWEIATGEPTLCLCPQCTSGGCVCLRAMRN
jgi:serine/threonine protein kinase